MNEKENTRKITSCFFSLNIHNNNQNTHTHPKKMSESIFARMADAVKSGLQRYTEICKPSAHPEITSETRDDFKATALFRVKGVLPCENVGIFSDCIEDSLKTFGARATVSFPASSHMETNDAIVTAYIPHITTTPTVDAMQLTPVFAKKRGMFRKVFCCCCNSWCGCMCMSIFVSIIVLFMSMFYAIYMNRANYFNSLK